MRKSGRPETIIGAYLADKLERWPKLSTDNPDSFISFAGFLRQLVQVFLLHELTPDLHSSTVLSVAKENPFNDKKVDRKFHPQKKLITQIHLKDWIDKNAEACKFMPGAHNKNSFYGRTHQLGKLEQRINARKNYPLCSQSHKFRKRKKNE